MSGLGPTLAELMRDSPAAERSAAFDVAARRAVGVETSPAEAPDSGRALATFLALTERPFVERRGR